MEVTSMLMMVGTASLPISPLDGGLQHLFPLFFRTFPLHFFLLSAFPGFSPCLPLSAARQR